MKIEQLLKNKTAKERATIKGQEIAKIDFRGVYVSSEYGVKIDIQSIKAVEGGVEILARAWKGNKQLGFGVDGSVEIEKFRFMNPPVLIDDSNGDIVREWIDNITGELKQRKLREDPIEAIRQSLAHTISVGNGKTDTNIIQGKRGSTQTTFFPAAGANSPVDGVVDTFGISTDWDTAHDLTSATGRSFDSNTTGNIGVTGKITGANIFIARGFYLFDTSTIGTDIVDSAILSVMASENGENGDNDADDFVVVVQSSPASNDALVDDDIDQCGAIDDPTEGSDRIDVTSMATDVYDDWTLNSTGIGFIDTSGISKFGIREGHDVLDNPYAGANDTKNGATHFFADETGTTKDPKLVVTHSPLVTGWYQLETHAHMPNIFKVKKKVIPYGASKGNFVKDF